MKRTIVYFTDSRLEEELDLAVRTQILKAANGIPIISVTQKPIDFGKNICVGFKPRCYLSLYEQLLIGIKAAPKGSIVYTCEHDVFYNYSHFEFIPPLKDRIYYNLNRFYWKRNEKFFLSSIGKRALSQGAAHRDIFLAHAKEQVVSRKEGNTAPCVGPFLNFESKHPNVDIRHGSNFSIFGMFDESHKSRRIPDINYWGTPEQFQEKTNLIDKNIDTVDRLEEMFKDGTDGFFRKDFPELFKLFGFNEGAEIGVKIGKFSKLLCEGVPGLHMKCIDPYLPGPNLEWDRAEGLFVAACLKLSPFNAEIIKKTSAHAAADDVPKWSLDFVYIDADHSFDEVMQDIIVWSARVRPGGIVAGHDYDDLDVKAAIDTYARVHDIRLYITEKGSVYPDSSPSWFFAK